jgi:hypothetical protein
MEPEIQRDTHELLTSFGYRESEACNWNQSMGIEAKYYRDPRADDTIHQVHIHDNGIWEHSAMPIYEDRFWLSPDGSGQGLDSLKAFLQKQHRDALKNLGGTDGRRCGG